MPCLRCGCCVGDWFNRLDFSYQSNNFGVGLPPAAKNEATWAIKQPLLADQSLRPSPELIKVGLPSTHLSQTVPDSTWLGQQHAP